MIAQNVLINAKIKHAIKVLVCVIRDVRVDTREITVISRAATIVMVYVYYNCDLKV